MSWVGGTRKSNCSLSKKKWGRSQNLASWTFMLSFGPKLKGLTQNHPACISKMNASRSWNVQHADKSPGGHPLRQQRPNAERTINKEGKLTEEEGRKELMRKIQKTAKSWHLMLGPNQCPLGGRKGGRDGSEEAESHCLSQTWCSPINFPTPFVKWACKLF